MNELSALVTAVITTMHGGSSLRSTVHAALGQTWRNLEVMVVPLRRAGHAGDDLDDLAALDPRVTVLPPVDDVAVARNSAVSASGGEYLAFLADGDSVDAERFDRQLATLSAQPDAAGCYGDWRTATSCPDVDHLTPLRTLAYPDLLSLAVPPLSTVTVRRAVFEQIGGFDPTELDGTSVDFLLHVGMRGTLAPVDHVVTDHQCTEPHRPPPDLAPILKKHQRRALDAGDGDAVVAAELGLQRNRRIQARAALADAMAAGRHGNVAGVVGGMAKAATRAPGATAGAVWVGVTKRPAPALRTEPKLHRHPAP